MNFANEIDPAIIGPGYWSCIHIVARDMPIEFVLEFMDFLVKSFPCSACRGHIQDYFAIHPLLDHPDLDRANGLGVFHYFFTMHNVVNGRIGKPMLSWAYVRSAYITG